MRHVVTSIYFWLFVSLIVLALVALFLFPGIFGGSVNYTNGGQKENPISIIKNILPKKEVLDTKLYDEKMLELANNPPPKEPTTKVISTKNKDGTVTKTTVAVPPPPAPPQIWPVKAPYPKAGAILPFNRIIAYYGNLYSTKMGVLGQYPEDQMLAMLQNEVKKWNNADPGTPAIPALHYIVVVAQGAPGQSGKYRLRMPFTEIDKVIAMAKKINGIVFLDVQVGLSDVQTEIPELEPYLKMPQVHLGLDPEFSMKTGKAPGKVIGTMDASDINFASSYLAKVVKDNDLPPKILVVHRFTKGMLTNYKEIKTTPEVQIVINMDGWGPKAKKIGTYKQFIYPEPVQFTGFKLFYKNDVLEPNATLLTALELLQLNPRPIYIQFQ